MNLPDQSHHWVVQERNVRVTTPSNAYAHLWVCELCGNRVCSVERPGPYVGMTIVFSDGAWRNSSCLDTVLRSVHDS